MSHWPQKKEIEQGELLLYNFSQEIPAKILAPKFTCCWRYCSLAPKLWFKLLGRFSCCAYYITTKRHTFYRQLGTVWKLRNFTTIQILREIKFGKVRSLNTAIVTVLNVLSFNFWWNCTFASVENAQNRSFWDPKIAKFDFTKILSGR